MELSLQEPETQSAGGVVINKEGKILITSQRGDSWSLPKGHVEEGEDDLRAAMREIMEETGVSSLTLLKDLGSYTRYKIGKGGTGEDTSERKSLHFFLFETNEDQLKPVDLKEHPEARWAEPEEAVSMLTHPADGAFLKRILPDIRNVRVHNENKLSSIPPYFRWISAAVIGLFLLALGALVLVSAEGVVKSSPTLVYVRDIPVRVDIADSEMERIQGLSGRKLLPEGEGLLFVFEIPDRHGFWMKDMHFPIDILWFDERKVLIHAETEVSPSTYPTSFTPNTPALYVLEVPAGFIEKHKIIIGDILEI